MLKVYTVVILFCLPPHLGVAQSQLLYKKVGTDSLYIEFDLPDANLQKPSPLVVFFFGGGWNTGSINQFRPHADYLRKRGIATAMVDYRVYNRQGTSPFASLRDAKSAIRYLRKHADSLGIDTNRIAAVGASAGGHLAAATALIESYNEPTDDISISCKPNALILFNPVVDNGPAGYGYERIQEQYLHFSPLHNVKQGAPTTTILIGTKDHLIPVETVEYFKMQMQKVGSRCDLNLYEDQKHGFFNYKNFDNYKETLLEADLFLQSLGWLSKLPKIQIE